MSMLGLSIAAGIPIIRTTTSDVMNVDSVLSALAPDKNIVPWQGLKYMASGDLFYALDATDVRKLDYSKLLEQGKVLVLINQGEDSPFAFDAGEMPVPSELQQGIVAHVCTTKAIPEIMQSVKGLTLKQTGEALRLAATAYQKIEARGVAAIRSQLIGVVPGLKPVDTALPIYVPDPRIIEWIELNRKYFKGLGVNPALIPRGVLFDGMAGVGKSQGAKFIANEFGIPLYRLNLAGGLSKWRGESEQNIERALTAIDREEPAALLIDEAEKDFNTGHEDEGGTARLLGQLLFWLQEHKSRVLTIMTTNAIEKLPPELYRPGRIDVVIELQPLDKEAALALAALVFKKLKGSDKITAKEHAALKASLHSANTHLSHADVTNRAQNAYKRLDA